MRKYHHVGIPTKIAREGEYHLEEFGVHVCSYARDPYGIEWMRYDPDSPVHELIRSTPHVAFEVDDLEAELENKEILVEPNSPSAGVTVAFIVEDGAPIEFLQFDGDRKID